MFVSLALQYASDGSRADRHVRNLEAGCFISQIERADIPHEGHEGTETAADATLCCV